MRHQSIFAAQFKIKWEGVCVGRFLLAAEADKIQDFVFRSSRLKEVVGGSQLLTRFCQKVPELLLPHHEGTSVDIIVNEGGAFRIVFDRQDQAVAFGEELAEVYHLATDSSLTVAEPVEINGDFGTANLQADENLRRAKRWRESWRGQEQMPYMAFCESCGIGIAETYQKDNEGQSRYLCASCLYKKAEEAEKLGVFLEPFYEKVMALNGKDLVTADWPGRGDNDPTQDVAVYDPRDYLAYLLADGNDMGKIFSECKKLDQMQKLSRKLKEVMREALAEPTKKIIENNPLEKRKNFIPVLPLIMGGDDLFALIPAPWALDFAKCFCRVYEQKIAEFMEEICLTGVQPTISAAVVICKRKYPYKIAYQVGHACLKEAKGLSKEKNRSIINYELLKGGSLSYKFIEKEIRPTLRPYWATEENMPGWGLSIQRLLDQRRELGSIPNKRLSELQNLYDLENLPDSFRQEEFPLWKIKLEKFLNRLKERSEVKAANLVETSLRVLGQADAQEDGWLYRVTRQRGSQWWGHGLPDLLEVWDFALELDRRRSEYEEG